MSANHAPCPNCGVFIDTDSRFCKHCAFDLVSFTPSLQTAGIPQQEGNFRFVPIILGIAVVIVFAIAAFGFYLYKTRAMRSEQSNVGNQNRESATPTPSRASSTMSSRALRAEAKIVSGERLAESDLAGLTAFEFRILRNANFARHGRQFDSPELREYFSSRSWYRPNDNYADSMLDETDRANVAAISLAEGRIR